MFVFFREINVNKVGKHCLKFLKKVCIWERLFYVKDL